MIIITESTNNTQRVLNIMYHNQIKIAEAWMGDYLTQQMESLGYSPTPKNHKYISYMINENLVNDSIEMTLVRRYKKIHAGYVYNTGEWIEENLFTLKYMCYNTPNSFAKTQDWQDVNTEINKAVLSQLDRDNLYYVLSEVDTNLKAMMPEFSVHFTQAVSQTLRSTYKDLYKTIIKRMKRMRGKID